MAETLINRSLKVAVDFDGVLHDHKHPLPGRTMGEPIEGALAGVCRLILNGHVVVVFTARGDRPDHIRRWLDYYGFPGSLMRITNVKEDFDVIIDDRAIQFKNWDLTTADWACMVSTSEKRTESPLAEPGSTPGGSTVTGEH